MNHTPGPWCVGHIREQRVDKRLGPMWELPVHVGEGANRGNTLAIVYIGGPGAITNSKDAVEANGHLIAAAPLMLEALKSVAYWLSDANLPCCFPRQLVFDAIDSAENKAKVAP